jgi:hypothetical protein
LAFATIFVLAASKDSKITPDLPGFKTLYSVLFPDRVAISESVNDIKKILAKLFIF